MKWHNFCLYLILSLFFGSARSMASVPVVGNPTGQVGLVDCFSAQTLGFTKLHFSLMGNFSYDDGFVSEFVRREGLFADDTLAPFAVMYGIHPAIGFGLTDFFDVTVQQPFYMDILEGMLPSGGLGDMSLGLKCRVPGQKPRPVQAALLSRLTVPTGNRTEGFFPLHGYYLLKNGSNTGTTVDPVACLTAQKPTWTIAALGTVGSRRLFVHLNLGMVVPFDSRLDKSILGSAGFEFHATEAFAMFADIYAEPRLGNLHNGFNIVDDQLHFSPGISFRSPGGATLAFGSSFKMSSDRELVFRDSVKYIRLITRLEPQWRVFLKIGWDGFLISRDKDRDGVLDRDDRCIDVKEDADGFEDGDGCPDYDNDRDEIPDSLDKCFNAPEDNDGFEDQDGCPDYDNDADGIFDSIDRCPGTLEDRDGFEDGDGCPDFDNDADGVPDSLDKCMGIPEDNDGFELDGCPDYDNDADGIPDSIDQCPDSVGSAERSGCPKLREKTKEIRFGRLILPEVHFDGGSADLAPGSSGDLDRVYQSLADWPEVRIEIQAHTDNSASPEASANLSSRRAAIVRDYLVQKGIDSSRLKTAGKGSSDPIADNKTIQGRRLNSRIEIHRID